MKKKTTQKTRGILPDRQKVMLNANQMPCNNAFAFKCLNRRTEKKNQSGSTTTQEEKLRNAKIFVNIMVKGNQRDRKA